MNPQKLEWIQQTNFKNYAKGKQVHDCLSVLGDGIFAADGATVSQQTFVRERGSGLTPAF